MIADASLSSAFDDLADLFLGGGGGVMGESTGAPAAIEPSGNGRAAHDAASEETGHVPAKPINVEGLILGHLPMMASLWASQYPRMAAAADNAPVAMIRLDGGTARVELFHPPLRHAAARMSGNGTSHNSHDHALPDRPSPDLAGALSRAAQVGSRVIIYSSVPADELLFARSSTVRAMAVLTGADDASAVGAYKAIKRLATAEHPPSASASAAHALLFRIAVMGSEETRASAAFHRLADAAKSFLSVPIEFAGHCRQIAGGVPGAILFEGPSAMTTQAVLEALSRPASTEMRPTGCGITSTRPRTDPVQHLPANPVEADSPARVVDSASAVKAPVTPSGYSAESAALGITHTAPQPSSPPMHAPATRNGHARTSEANSPVGTGHALPGLTTLSIRCPFDREPILAIDTAGIPQVITTAAAGRSAEATQQLLSVAAWFWTSRELLGMVCPALRTDAQPIMHLITDRPTDVKRLIDSDLRLHVRIPPAPQPDSSSTLALN